VLTSKRTGSRIDIRLPVQRNSKRSSQSSANRRSSLRLQERSRLLD
jgi:hypothetical protein